MHRQKALNREGREVDAKIAKKKNAGSEPET